MAEKIKTNYERDKAESRLSPEHVELHEALEQKRTNESERGRESETVESTRARALEAAKSAEKATAPKEGAPERRNRPISRKELDRSFNSQMSAVRLHMSAPSRAFSRVIHNKAIERASNAAGSTVARPNAILSGSAFAFIAVLGVYLVAKYFGYRLSGSETMIAFAFGWLLGIIYDYIRITLRGRS